MNSKKNAFVFKPSKNSFQLTSNTKNNTRICIKKSLKHTLTTLNKKCFNNFKPVRPFQRFMKIKISNSGINEEAAFLRFSQRDYSKPYKKKLNPILLQYKNYSPPNNCKWSIGTTYICNNEKLIPKKDPFKEYHFTKKINDTKNSQNSFLPTMKNNNRNSFLEMKEEYNNTTESGSFWSPYKSVLNTVANRSSVNYNIINHSKNEISGAKNAKLFDKVIHNKNKGIEEFIDKQRLYAPNINVKYNQLFNDNQLRFRIYKGLFTDRYDSANKSGSNYNIFQGNKITIENNEEKNKKNVERKKLFYKL